MSVEIYAPDYYGAFKCIAGDCKHSCCVGWEIDIDEESLSRYDSVSGEIGRRLAKNIERDCECPHFITDDSEKCPFLNTCGLCDLIIELGEDSLCDICREHPRFRNDFSDRVEIGLGLCCEAAAELVLSHKDKTALVKIGEEEGEQGASNEEEIEVLRLRAEILDILQDRSLPLKRRLDAALERVDAENVRLSVEEQKQLFSSLEYMDAEFAESLQNALDISLCEADLAELKIPLEQLAVYFIIRHFSRGIYCGDLSERVAFAVIGVETVLKLSVSESEKFGDKFAALCDMARRYSAEIEYSEDNTDAIISAFGDKLYTE